MTLHNFNFCGSLRDRLLARRGSLLNFQNGSQIFCLAFQDLSSSFCLIKKTKKSGKSHSQENHGSDIFTAD